MAKKDHGHKGVAWKVNTRNAASIATQALSEIIELPRSDDPTTNMALITQAQNIAAQALRELGREEEE